MLTSIGTGVQHSRAPKNPSCHGNMNGGTQTQLKQMIAHANNCQNKYRPSGKHTKITASVQSAKTTNRVNALRQILISLDPTGRWWLNRWALSGSDLSYPLLRKKACSCNGKQPTHLPLQAPDPSLLRLEVFVLNPQQPRQEQC